MENSILEKISIRYKSMYQEDINEDLVKIKECSNPAISSYSSDDCKFFGDVVLEGLVKSYTVEALYFLYIENNPQKAKQSFYLGGQTQLLHKKLNDKSFLEVVPHYEVASILLSDSSEQLENFKNLKFSDNVYQEDLKIGSYYILVQASLKTKEEFKSAIDLYKKNDNRRESNIDFFEALYNADKGAMLKSINTFLSKSYHNSLNTHSTLRDMISIVATAYAKLAYIHGYELDIDHHPLIPKELLPVKPNDEYWEYDFMKEGKYKDV